MRTIQGIYVPVFYGSANVHGHMRPAIVLQYLSGSPLCNITDVEKSRWTRIVTGIYDAFNAISKHGIYHTDVSEANIIISDSGHDKVYIIDFGVVKFEHDLNECRLDNENEAEHIVERREQFCKEARPDGTVLVKRYDRDEYGHRQYPMKWVVQSRKEHFKEVEETGVTMLITCSRGGGPAPPDAEPRVIYGD